MLHRGSSFVALALVGLLLTGCVDAPRDASSLPEGPAAWSVVNETLVSPPDRRGSEVSVATDPLDPEHVVVAAHSLGGPSGVAFSVATTFDAGRNWSVVEFTRDDLVRLAGPRAPFLGFSDPVVVIDHEGVVWLSGLAILPSSAVWVTKSYDGGLSFAEASIVWESDVAARFNDKQWMGVHPTTGTVYVSWQQEPLLDTLRTVDETFGVDADVGDIVLSLSRDGGETWSLPEVVSEGLHNNGTQVAFTSSGRAVLLWVNYERPGLDVRLSDDDGASWGPVVEVTDVKVVPPFARYARMHTLPALTADPGSDRLVAVWHDARGDDPDVLAVLSEDGGKGWSTPAVVHPGSVADGAVQFYPWAAFGPDGRVHVTYYDSRSDIEHPRFRYWHSWAEPEETGGLAFHDQGPVSNATFTIFAAEGGADKEQRGIGDYTGVAASSAGVFPAWADGSSDEARVHAARVLPTVDA